MAGDRLGSRSAAETHSLRLAIIEYAAADPEREFAAIDLAREWGFSAPMVSNHLRDLHEMGLLDRAPDRLTGGSPARCFRASGKLLA